jgi:hypothetical protein
MNVLARNQAPHLGLMAPMCTDTVVVYKPFRGLDLPVPPLRSL